MKRVHVLVAGRVQGVFYRSTCAKAARRLGMTGFVRNLPDGRVEAAFEGADADVDLMVAWCRRGPELARVDEIQVEPEPVRADAAFQVTG